MKDIELKEKYHRAKLVKKIIRLAYDSLDSHLDYTHIKTSEGADFHKNAIKDYVEIIKTATELW